MTRVGATLNFFLLGDDPGLARFVDAVARRNGGRVLTPETDRLGEYVVADYLRARRGGSRRDAGPPESRIPSSCTQPFARLTVVRVSRRSTIASGGQPRWLAGTAPRSRSSPAPARGPVPCGVPDGGRPRTRGGPPAGGADQDVRRVATAARHQQGRGLHAQGDHYDGDLVVAAQVVEEREAARRRARVGRARRDRAASPNATGCGSELQTLAPKQRAAIVLRYYEDLTEAQTAEAMRRHRRHRQEPGVGRAEATPGDPRPGCRARRQRDRKGWPYGRDRPWVNC